MQLGERGTRGWIRSAVTATALAGAAIALAGPASAVDPVGHYMVKWSDGSKANTWTITSCGQDCIHISGYKGWSTDAHLAEGTWNIDPIVNTVSCPDGSVESDTINGTFDATTLAGSSVITYPVPCPGGPPGGREVKFTMTSTD
jgi:hypothetical protein